MSFGIPNTIRNEFAFDYDDLTNPSSDQKYELGRILNLADVEPNPNNTVSDISNVTTKYIYINNVSGVAQFQPCIIERSTVISEEYKTAVPFTSLGPALMCCIPQVTIPTGEYGFALIEGYVIALATQPYTLDNYLELRNAATSFIDQAVNPTFKTQFSRAKANETGTVTGPINIYLLGANLQPIQA